MFNPCRVNSAASFPPHTHAVTMYLDKNHSHGFMISTSSHAQVSSKLFCRWRAKVELESSLSTRGAGVGHVKTKQLRKLETRRLLYVCVCVCVYVYNIYSLYTHTYIHTYIVHTYIHTYIIIIILGLCYHFSPLWRNPSLDSFH